MQLPDCIFSLTIADCNFCSSPDDDEFEEVFIARPEDFMSSS
jgi:hypothetical protein